MGKVDQSTRAEPFSPHRALRSLGAFALAGVAIAGAHLIFDIGIPCPLRTFTGILCPFCGATRAAGALANFDVGLAWGFNALLVLGIPVLGLLAIAWTVEVLGGPALRPPARLRPLTQNKVYLVLGIVATVFMVARNLT